MRMSTLQLGLIVAGVLLVVGVVVYNWLVERRVQRRIDAAFRPTAQGEPPRETGAAGRVEPSLREEGDAAALSGVHSSSAPGETRARPGVAVEHDPDWQPPVDIVIRGGAVAPGADAEAEPRDVPHPEPAGRSGHELPQPDPDIECVVSLQPVRPAGAGAVAAGLHARVGKPLRWFGRRGEGAAWQRLASDTPGEFAEIVACLLLADRNGPATRAQIDAFLRMLADLAPTIPAAFVAPEAEYEADRAEALDRLCAELDIQIGLTLQKHDAAPIAGTRLRGVAEAAGFRLAPSGRFEWVQEDTGTVLYALQAAGGDAFTADGLRTSSLAGVVFLLDVPRVADPVRAFDQMTRAARRMAQTLGAEIVDDNRRPLNEAGQNAIREQVRGAAAALAQVHIEPGSPRALKLFAA